MREAIKKEKPNKVSCNADELDIYSLQDSLVVFFQYPPRYPLIDILQSKSTGGAVDCASNFFASCNGFNDPPVRV